MPSEELQFSQLETEKNREFELNANDPENYEYIAQGLEIRFGGKVEVEKVDEQTWRLVVIEEPTGLITKPSHGCDLDYWYANKVANFQKEDQSQKYYKVTPL